MKTLLKVLALTLVAIVCAGFVYNRTIVNEHKTKLVKMTFVEKVHSGDTVDGILSNYYNEANEGVDFREYKYNILHLPENKHLLNEHGGLKLLQVGDKITIVANVQKAK